MPIPVLTGAQKSHLRGLGQRMDAALKIGKEGLTPTLMAEFRRQLHAHELVKVRFVAGDRHLRAELSLKIGELSESLCVGSVGLTALFYAPNPAAANAIEFP